MKTKEGAFAHEHSLDHALEFFSKAGSLYVKKKGFYKGEMSALDLFINSWIVNKPLSMKLLLWLRDCRGGAGNRSGARSIYTWLAESDDRDWLAANLWQIPEVGRWDDLRSLFGTPLESAAATFWANALVPRDSEPNTLAAKWAKRNDHPIRFALGGLTVGELRKLLASIRQTHIIEHKMCQKLWSQIKYEHVPSVAMTRYTKAFNRHDGERFQEFKNQVKRGEKTVHADVLFPHDCIRACRHGDAEMAELQFNALPNFMGDDSNENIMVLADTSGSMEQFIGESKNVEAIDISMSLALYCSAKMREDSPFYKRFIGFCSESMLRDWRGMSLEEAINNENIFDGAVGSTRIDTALNLILRIAKRKNIRQELMPTTLLIVSDMQFHKGGSRNNDTEVEHCIRAWEDAGYQRPKVVFWNTAGYKGQQAKQNMKNVGLISGFSPSILEAVLGGVDFSPTGIMLRKVEPYEIVIPDELNLGEGT